MSENSRSILDLTTDWFASISLADAVLAASTGGACSPADLELADDPENHPRRLDLPGDRAVGLRPLNGTLPPRKGEMRLPNPTVTYARRIAVPADWRNHTLFLLLDQTRYNVQVAINGHEVTRYVGGLEPHRIDVTNHLTPGSDVILTITVGNSGTSGKRPFDVYHFTGTRLPTCEEITDNLTHPVVYGGGERLVGSATLHALPRVRVDYVVADPKVSLGELHYTIALTNDLDEAVSIEVDSAVAETRELVAEIVDLPPRSSRTIKRTIYWNDAILWDTDNPHLYKLVTILRRDGRLVDQHHDTFGFREFTINGSSFYLNGKKIHLFGQSGHTQPEQDCRIPLEEKIAILRAWKEEGNVNHIRLHAKPQDKGWVEAADRVGMLITTETAMWTTNFHSFDFVGSEEACYANIRHHFFSALVERDRNNPSVIIWSLTNEMSPITRFDLENPKMAAMTRILERIVNEAREVPGSRVIQMSSAVDFLGRLDVYNLHYPKNWQAFPDYPNTAYWLEEGFLFPWYGPRRHELPPWSWRRDKPLIFGEFTCVYGPTPDNQAAIVGDVAFERPDFGTPLVQEKLWPMEMKAYRRQDVSGFTAWACMEFSGLAATKAKLQAPEVIAHAHALRPLAVLDHSYRTRYFAEDAVAMELSMHNDLRHPIELALHVVALHDGGEINRDYWPPATYGPAESVAFTSRFRAPAVLKTSTVTVRVELTSGTTVVDAWEKAFEISPRSARIRLKDDIAVYDPQHQLTDLFKECGLAGPCFFDAIDELPMENYSALLISFADGGISIAEWMAMLEQIRPFIRHGGTLIVDAAPEWLDELLPLPLERTNGYAENGQLQITYAFNAAPCHPIMKDLSDADFQLWGDDHLVAGSCFRVPQSGNAIPLLLAGVDREGLTSSPLLELPIEEGAMLLSTLELVSKLKEEPNAGQVLARLLEHRTAAFIRPVSVAVSDSVYKKLRQVGVRTEVVDAEDAIGEDIAIIDGDNFPLNLWTRMHEYLSEGATVYLHALSEEQTRQVLTSLKLPGQVLSGEAAPGEHDVFRHVHALTNGMSNNYLYWIVDKAKVAMWTAAPLHPKPASALIKLPKKTRRAWSLTRRGALTAYRVGDGLLVIDNLLWHLDFDEPERSQRYLTTLLTNLQVELMNEFMYLESEDYETAEERRERGHF